MSPLESFDGLHPRHGAPVELKVEVLRRFLVQWAKCDGLLADDWDTLWRTTWGRRLRPHVSPTDLTIEERIALAMAAAGAPAPPEGWDSRSGSARSEAAPRVAMVRAVLCEWMSGGRAAAVAPVALPATDWLVKLVYMHPPVRRARLELSRSRNRADYSPEVWQRILRKVAPHAICSRPSLKNTFLEWGRTVLIALGGELNLCSVLPPPPSQQPHLGEGATPASISPLGRPSRVHARPPRPQFGSATPASSATPAPSSRLGRPSPRPPVPAPRPPRPGMPPGLALRWSPGPHRPVLGGPGGEPEGGGKGGGLIGVRAPARALGAAGGVRGSGGAGGASSVRGGGGAANPAAGTATAGGGAVAAGKAKGESLGGRGSRGGGAPMGLAGAGTRAVEGDGSGGN